VATYVDGRPVSQDCAATEPRQWGARESLLQDGFPPPRDYTSHTYSTPNKTLEKYQTVPQVPGADGATGRHNHWLMCADRLDITAQLSGRTGPSVEVIMATAHRARGHPSREPATQNAGRQAYDRGSYRFKGRATLFLHLAPENSLKPYLGPSYGDTHIHIRPECLTADLLLAPTVAHVPGATQVVCMFGQQTSWQGGYGGALDRQGSVAAGARVAAQVEADGAVTCIAPDMSGQAGWQQLVVYRDINGTGTGPERASHALGFYLCRRRSHHQQSHSQKWPGSAEIHLSARCGAGVPVC
jgi:hypothetical protein